LLDDFDHSKKKKTERRPREKEKKELTGGKRLPDSRSFDQRRRVDKEADSVGRKRKEDVRYLPSKLSTTT